MKARLLLCAVTLTSLPAAHALACTAPSCFDTRVFPASGSVPANMVELLFTSGGSRGSALDAGQAQPRLYRLDGASKVSVPFSGTMKDRSLLITPLESQPAGAKLVLEADPAGCDPEPFQAEFTVGEPVALPTVLGTLDARTRRDVLQVSVINGSCSGLIDAAYADLTVQLSDAAAPYAGLWRHQLLVDGSPRGTFSDSLAGGVHPAQGAARIYAVCEKEPWLNTGGGDVSAGRHRVQVVSTLPDGTSLSTPEIEVDLRCDGRPGVRPPDASVPRDAAVNMSGPDANIRNDDVVESVVEADGDGCALTTRGGGAWLLALATFLLRRRRR